MYIKRALLISCLSLVSLNDGCGGSGETTPTPTPVPSPSPLPTPTPLPTEQSLDCPDSSGWTVGLIYCQPTAPVGYVLFGSLKDTDTFLLNTEGEVVNQWKSSYTPGQALYLLETGELLRTIYLGAGSNQTFQGAAGAGGGIQKHSWDGMLVWDWRYSSSTYLSHHDIEPLPNGNVLVIAWEYKTQSEAIAAGRNPSLTSASGLWTEKLLEVRPTGATTGEIVWEWKAWDHLIQSYDSTKPNYGQPSDHPERLNLNATASGSASTDWLHFNAVSYHSELDQIVVSSRALSEIFVIDHSTTTAQARSSSGGLYGRGGDFLYRWGNPQNYGAGTSAARTLFGQHSVHWIQAGIPGEGHLLLFNNGDDKANRAYSSIDELVTPLLGDGAYTFGAGQPSSPSATLASWTASPATSFYATRVSGAQRLAGGETFVGDGVGGDLFMLDAQGEISWYYVVPISASGSVPQGSTVPGNSGGSESGFFRAYFYPPTYAAFAGRVLTPQGYLEGSGR